ncbi:MAG: M1 family peptidase, partial [Bacteroidetes bacterium]|nr:M1 family peptidase [Bacteroidota bacterium]
YSILFNVGDYKVFSRPYTTCNGNKTTVQFYVLSEHADKAEHFLDLFVKTIHEQEKYFGEYPFAKEKIAMAETPHLGMEHQTMVAYGNKFRYTKIGGEDYDWLMHHEFGHEWWGNKVTAKDWADYWIHEGICSFGDALYTREFAGEEAYNKIFQRSVFSIENKLPIVQHPDMDEESAYINDIYSKGAFFMHTLRYVMGDSVFFPALKKFVTSPQYTYDNLVNTDDVEQFFTKEAGRDLKPLFDLYLRTTNKLDVHVKTLPGNKYLVQLQNIGIRLPLDITANGATKRIMIGSEGVKVDSKTLPVIDPEVFYIKRVTYE